MIESSTLNGFSKAARFHIHRTVSTLACTLAVVALTATLIAPSAVCEDEPPKKPFIQMCVPLGIVPGETMKLRVRGLNLDTATEVTSNLPEVAVRFLSAGKTGVPANLNAQQAGDTQVEFEIAVAADAVVDVVELTCTTSEGTATYALPVRTAECPLLEIEPNSGFKNAQPLELSRTLVGQIQSPQDVDVYAIELVEGTFVRIAISAAAHGSALDSLLTLYDADGSPLATHDDCSPSRDSLIEWGVLKSGRYFVAVQDANDLGGEAQPYRLRVEPAQ